ncbi:MAG: ATP-binding protein [Candidatus Sumerlaeaceae bacterium]|nr:ATP-binding protein [Candidatus Sumerlaeaceae bacterium]
MSAVGKQKPDLSVKTLASVGRLLSASADRPAGIRGALEVLREALGADHCGVLLAAGAVGRMPVVFHVEASGTAPPALDIPSDGSLSGEVTREGRLAVITNPTASGRDHFAGAEGIPVAAFVGVPLISEGQVFGILRATKSVPGLELDQEQRDLLSVAASLIASAVLLTRLPVGPAPNEAELVDVIENLPTGVVTADASLRVRRWNRRFLSLLCLPPDRIAAGKPLSAVMPHLLWSKVETNIGDSTEAGNESRMQHDLALPGGEVLPIEVRVAPLAADESSRHGVLLSITDMSLQRELAKLRRLEDLESNFLSMVSHELRTPLTSIKGAAGILSGSGASDPSQRETLLRIVQNNTERLIRLVDDLLDVSTIEHSTLTLNKEVLDLRVVVEAAVADMLGAAERKECTVRKELDELSKVRGDEKRLRQVFTQLMSNAVKFSRRGGEIVVRLTAIDGMARVVFRDCGPGIPLAARDKVFDKFFQVEDPMTRSAGGTGIGLYIAKAIVDAHNGRISVLDSGEWGTEMAVDLPLAEPSKGRPLEADGALWSG